MGLGIVVFVYLMVSGALFAGAALVCLVIDKATRARLPGLRPWLIAICVAAGAAPTMLLAANQLWANFAPADIRFREVFGVAPGKAIHDLKAQFDGGNDANSIDLAFATDEATSAALVRPPFRTIEGTHEIEDRVPLAGETVPRWWTGDRCAERTVHLSEHQRQWDEIVVTRCRSDGRTYVQARWIQ